MISVLSSVLIYLFTHRKDVYNYSQRLQIIKPFFTPRLYHPFSVPPFLWSSHMQRNRSALALWWPGVSLTLIQRQGLMAGWLESFFNILFLLFLERGEGRGEQHRCERETLIDCLSYIPPTRDRTHNAGMCPDQEVNQWPSTLWDDAPTNTATLVRARLESWLSPTLPFSLRWAAMRQVLIHLPWLLSSFSLPSLSIPYLYTIIGDHSAWHGKCSPAPTWKGQ